MIYYIWKDWCNDKCQLPLMLQNSELILLCYSSVVAVPKEVFFLSVFLVNSKLLIKLLSYIFSNTNIKYLHVSLFVHYNPQLISYFVLFLRHTHAQRDHWYVLLLSIYSISGRIGMTWAGTLTSLLCIVFISLPSSSADKKMCTKR